MPSRDPRIDAYIAKSPEFARPILTRLREQVHAACPEAEEDMKWSRPHFLYRGGILCGMAAFKQHCAFGFWAGPRVVGDAARHDEAMGQLGRLTSVEDLPPAPVLAGYVRQAMAERDTPSPTPAATARRAPRPTLEVPDFLAAALAQRKHAKARAAFDAFAPSHRREYIEWLVDAKTDATREKRLAQALEWLAEGKSRNWKYERQAGK